LRSLGPLTLGQLGGQSSPRPLAQPLRVARETSRHRGEPLQALVKETLELCRRLRAAGERLHGQGVPSAARRQLLRWLERHGAQTVPQMARARSVTRQHVQALVNLLAEAGYVEFMDNPAHKRSLLVRLTRRGRECVAALERREARILSQLNVGATSGELRQAAAVLGGVREALDDESWSRLLEGEAGVL